MLLIGQIFLIDVIQRNKNTDNNAETPNAEYQRCGVIVRNDLVERKIKSCRKSSKRFSEFKKKVRIRT